MKRISFVLALVLVIEVLSPPAYAHVGSPTVFFEGLAGPYKAHVIVRPAEVIPGLAEITVRVEGASVTNVTALPIKWNAGRQGAPPPDIAKAVAGETNLYAAQLWFMESGPHSVEIEIAGAAGSGKVTVPVDAVATRMLGMPKVLGVLLGAFGLLLLLLLISIVGAAVRESVIEPGSEPPRKRRLWARVIMVGVALLLGLLLWGGKQWWQAEAADYRNNRLYRPVEMRADVYLVEGQRALRLEIPGFGGAPPLMPDHGKLMHLFLVREPDLDAFAHLHPVKRDKRTFEAALPELPAGAYQLYADITYETGESGTLTAKVEVPNGAGTRSATRALKDTDSDDSWTIASPFSATLAATRQYTFENGMVMSLVGPQQIEVNKPMELRFAVAGKDGQPVALEPYLGMRGHLALRRDDGAVFTHLHPGGSASMAAMQLSVLRADGRIPLKAALGADDPLCTLPVMTPGEQPWLSGIASPDASTVSFPYAFPKPGAYRLWVQVRISGQVMTGVFDVRVSGVQG